MTSETHEHHGPGYGLLTGILALLLALTAATVWVTSLDLGFLHVAAALIIATVKAGLVVFYFMHLKYENWLLKGFVLMTFAILAIFIGFTFFDTAYRGTT
ncbi:cytochrome C oxidase subunit IV family protein [Desulfocurvus sp. DL9XJH121]